MTTAEVFAMNIQIPQLKAAVPQYEWTTERLEDERNYFLWWLNKQVNEFNYKLTDQLTAWNLYTLYHSFDEIDDEEEFTPSWMDEIDQAINNAVRVANYSDYGGQL